VSANARASTLLFPPLVKAQGVAFYRNAAVWSLRALLAVVIFAWFAVTPANAPRLAMALALGGRVMHAHEFGLGWLSAAIVRTIGDASGLGGIAALSGASVVLTLALVEFRARRRAGYVLSLFAGIVAAFGYLDVLHIGAGATGWVCAAALLLLIDRARGASLVAGVTMVSIAWCNLAPQGIFAPLLIGLVAIGRTVDRGSFQPEARAEWLALAGASLALLCTPAGIGFAPMAALAAHLHEGLDDVIPLAPYLTAPQAYYALFLAVVVAGAALGIARRTEDRLLVAAGLVLCFSDGSTAPLLGIIAAPILVGTLVEKAPAMFAEPPARARLTDGLIAALTLAVALTIAAAIHPRPEQTLAADTPYALLQRYAVSSEQPRRVLCSVVAWCDYAVALPRLRALMDDRIELTDGATRKAQHDVTRVQKGWKQQLARHRIDAVLTHRSDALAALLVLDSHWTAFDARGGSVLFERETR